MHSIKVHDKEFIPYLNSQEIEEQVSRVAGEINLDYEGRKPLFIAILNGAFMFAADLFKEINVEAEICFIKLASYKGVKSTGQVITAIGLDADIYHRDVIIIEDIVDTGKTLSHFLPQLKHHHPASLKIASLLHKPDAMVHPLKIDYLGFTIPNKFVVGYGL
ncbi:MAG: hypoxanthine phosphoribosyltransferase, partial [Bacteroidota bacterium]|nr:hypoxanthine phosphoribosyltransferase [Bacteroidota bacterium]